MDRSEEPTKCNAQIDHLGANETRSIPNLMLRMRDALESCLLTRNKQLVGILFFSMHTFEA